ncbi:terminase small subunit [Gilvimarinus chinensis]|uniref:terminase small subunit n=1 Tax=Gilvimarinus chinensis TaxID=396005 RepID=UPI00036C78D1|nr:terminase small subunit [Gilvimarinus chinensis]
MAKLTEKQERFCLAYIETGNASEAYRRSYDCSNSSESSVNRLAKALMDNIKIASRIDELRAPVREKAQLTLEQHLEDLKRLRDKAEQEGKFAAAVTAETNRGKASGLYVEKHEHTGKDGEPIQTNTTFQFIGVNADSD